MRRFLIAAALVFVALPLLATGVPVAPGIIGPASGPRSSPELAAGPDQLLAVWYDGTSVVATRLRSDGTPIDALPIRIGERGHEGGWRDIGVAWNGSNYRIVWRRERNGLSELATAALRADGNIIDPERQFSSDGASPSIAWNGERHLVVWQSTWGGSYVRIQALDVNGAPLGEPRSLGRGEEPAVATNGRDFFVVFINGVATGQMVRGSGQLEAQVVLASPLESNTRDGWTSIASDGTNFLTLWTRFRGGIRRRMINADGQQAGLEIVVPADGGDVQHAVWDGSSYWLSVSDFQGFQSWLPGSTSVRRLTSEGLETGEPIVLATSGAPIPAFTVGSVGVAVVMAEGRVSQYGEASARSDQIYARLLQGETRHLLSRDRAPQSWPAVASNDHAALVAWSEESGTDRRKQIRVRMHDRTMRARGGAWFVAPSENYQDGAAVGASQDGFLLAWFEAASGSGSAVLKGAIINTLETSAGDALTIAIDASFLRNRRIAVASDGSDYLVGWSDNAGRMWMRRVGGDGALLNDPVPLSLPGHALPYTAWAALASNGSNYLLVGADEFGVPCQYTCPDSWVYEIWSMRVGRDGMPAPESRRRLSLPDRYGYAWGEYPSVAADGETFVAMWSWAGRLHTQRIDPAGIPSGNALVIADGYWSSIAKTPEGLRVAWVGWDSENRRPILSSVLDRVLFPGTPAVIVEDAIEWSMPTVVPLQRAVLYAHDVVDGRGMVQQQIMMTTESDSAVRRRAVRRPAPSGSANDTAPGVLPELRR
ncbi:MAG: hypothetical protein ACYC7A_12745 [Thermoanaerobaculia bacterium]